jgi:hypothetical protein
MPVAPQKHFQDSSLLIGLLYGMTLPPFSDGKRPQDILGLIATFDSSGYRMWVETQFPTPFTERKIKPREGQLLRPVSLLHFEWS